MATPNFFSGGLVESTRNESITVGTSVVHLSEARNEANPRKVILVRNISGNGNRVTVWLSQLPASANAGIILEDGESFSDTQDQGYQCYQGMITAVGSAANSTISIFER